MIKKEINDLRRDLGGISARAKSVKDATVELIGFQGRVTWNQMVSIEPEIGRLIDIKGTHNYIIKLAEFHWVWNTTIHSKEEFYPPHYHDFWEICRVKSGILTEVETGKEYKAGEYVVYKINQFHHPRNSHVPDCDLDVHWINIMIAKTEAEAMAIVIEYYNTKTNDNELQQL